MRMIASVRLLRDGEPCNHAGCANHRTHPCEGCGRRSVRGVKILYAHEYVHTESEGGDGKTMACR